jgi:Concanavalin A-like lectin/glucanases superfamily/Thrombospondin type 3 repeat
MVRRGLGRLVVLVSLAFFLFAAPLAHATPHLLGQWHFDATANGGTATPDSSGNGNDLAGNSVVLSGGGRFNSYMTAGGEFWTPPVTAAGIVPTHVTLLAWIKGSGTPGDDEVIAGQAVDGKTCDRMSYRLRYQDGDSFSGLEFSVIVGGQVVASPPIGTNDVWDGNWHFVAGTYDGSKVHLFVDGSEVGSGTPTPGGPIGYGSPAGKFGADGYTGDLHCASRTLADGVDELRVYDEALTAAEIADLANPSHTTPPTLVPDTDDDGVPDPSDNCVSTANPDQADGDHNGVGDACQDSDGDGVVDVHDNCPDVSNPNQADNFLYPGVGAACDQDFDGIRDSSDNCPSFGNHDQRDDNGDGIGHACQLPVPKLTVSPNPTCTGILTSADGTGSTGGDDPIASYHLAYGEKTVTTVDNNFFNNVYGGRTVDLGTSSTPNFVAVFDWNIQSLYNPFRVFSSTPTSAYDPPRRDPVDLELDVTNTAGQIGYSTVRVDFAQTEGDKSRSACPGGFATVVYHAPKLKSLGTNSAGSSVSFKSACRNEIDCVGSSLLTYFNLFGAGATHPKPKPPKAVLVGLSLVHIPKGQTSTITVKLNKKGRKLLKKRHKLDVTLTLVTVSATGKNVTSSHKLTLKPRKKKQKH